MAKVNSAAGIKAAKQKIAGLITAAFLNSCEDNWDGDEIAELGRQIQPLIDAYRATEITQEFEKDQRRRSKVAQLSQ